ncbi:HAD family hydrolase [Hydrogenimonas cancrithermarum]|uniref:Hydrolase n=1 Tax=Hydrogenimonas cancrithermarum TaxID=2993563 RepID=A0ABM8FKH8_9BACT|nr:HAD family hydrolase [Hydrogenimonas cancrithermarum]BDY12802.1 hydrolase [Hydrogenimonas cancrithermarum]
MTTILFDLDGTLIDSTEAILESFSVAYDTFSQNTPEADEIKALIGYPLDVMFVRLGVDSAKVDAFVQAYKMHYRKISRQKTVLLPGAKEAVERASGFARLGVVTTKTGRYSRELLEHMGLMHHFEVLIGREDVTHPKPHPEPIHKALASMEASPANTWMIGDTLLDVHAAHAAGVTPYALTCGYGSEEELSDACEHVAKDVKTAIENIAMKKSLL